MGHSESVEESSLVIEFTGDPKLIYIEYYGAGSPKIITYTQGFGEIVDNIYIEEPTLRSEEYTGPFQPQDNGSTYKCVRATAWDEFEQPIVSNQLIYQSK